MIKATGEIVNPDAIALTLTLTMTIGEWRSIAERLTAGDYWPDGKTASCIKDVVRKMTSNVTEVARAD